MSVAASRENIQTLPNTFNKVNQTERTLSSTNMNLNFYNLNLQSWNRPMLTYDVDC